jgi:hypothetical protein
MCYVSAFRGKVHVGLMFGGDYNSVNQPNLVEYEAIKSMENESNYRFQKYRALNGDQPLGFLGLS